MARVSVYVDGFNLYHSLEFLKEPPLKWLNLWELSKSFLKPHETLVSVKYFTSLSTWDLDKQNRHKKYIKALELQGISILYGKFKNKTYVCSECGNRHKSHEEKRTDVNIAVHLLCDAVKESYDVALLISGDTDLIPAIQSVKSLYPLKRIGVVFPFNRHTTELDQVADFSDVIKADRLRKVLLPDQLLLASGKYLTRPTEWL